MRRCERMTKSLRWIGSQVGSIPIYDGFNNLEFFIEDFEKIVLEPQRILALYITLKATPARWWGVHKKTLETWSQCKELLQVRFSEELEFSERSYTGFCCPKQHVTDCVERWKNIPKEQWVHKLVHTLDIVPRNWYTKLEVCRGTTNWEEMTKSFLQTFQFEDEDSSVREMLQIIKGNIFEEVFVPLHDIPIRDKQLQKVHECYNIITDNDEEDPRETNITESEGQCAVVGVPLENFKVGEPLKTKKVNIGTKENLKFAHIGDYWDKDTVEKITDLLQEYQELFPMKFSEMKGIIGDLGEMKIPLKEGVRTVKHRPYRLNPRSNGAITLI